MIISEMQRKLATWTTAYPSRRVDRLLRLIAQPDWLAEAARVTLSSKGANTPGIDGEIKLTVQDRLPAIWDLYGPIIINIVAFVATMLLVATVAAATGPFIGAILGAAIAAGIAQLASRITNAYV